MIHPTRVKLADVAAHAGVSVATVSKVVNERYGVSRETIDRVRNSIDELGYAGNLSASSLRSSRTNVLGILVASFEPYSAELLKGASRVAETSEYELLAYTGRNAAGWERRSLARLGGTLIDGAILVTPTVVGANAPIPVVAVDPHYGPSDLAWVDADSYRGARLATEHLIGLGHTRIGLLGGRRDLDSAILRERGYRDSMESAGLALDESLVRDAGYETDPALVAARELLERKDRPTAIFAANDMSALAVVAVAKSLGIRVPQDLSVVGFDDVPDAALASPSLTTVRQPLQKMGEEAMKLLLDILGNVDRPHHVRLPVELIVRDTSGPPGQP